MNLMSYSGGLIYHWRARRHAKCLWAGHRSEVARWLEAWAPQERHLILVGPSGGYSLPDAWLGRFETITAVDPDPLALWILKRRLGPRLRPVKRADLIADKKGDWRKLRGFLAEHSGAAVLFCNVLGQLDFLLKKTDPESRRYFQGLEAALRDIHWASYHDRISGELRPRHLAPTERALTNAEIATRFYSDSDLPEFAASKPSHDTVLADHSTGLLAPERARNYWVWELQPGRYHLIEGLK